MKFEIIAPDNGNGEFEKPEENLESSLKEIMKEFSNLRERGRWKNRRKPVRLEKLFEAKIPAATIKKRAQRIQDKIGTNVPTEPTQENHSEISRNQVVKDDPPEIRKDPPQLRRKPRRLGQTMNLSEWILQLEPIEQAYVRQCFHFWNGPNGGIEPSLPRGMSKTKAEILKYHCKSLNDGKVGKRKIDQTKTIIFRCTETFFKQLAFEASELDVSLSEYIRRCVNIGRPVVLAYPTLSKIFEDPCLRNDPLEET